jgi:hypothetical protein
MADLDVPHVFAGLGPAKQRSIQSLLSPSGFRVLCSVNSLLPHPAIA